MATKGQTLQLNCAFSEQADRVTMGSPIGPFAANVFQFEENLELKAKLCSG